MLLGKARRPRLRNRALQRCSRDPLADRAADARTYEVRDLLGYLVAEPWKRRRTALFPRRCLKIRSAELLSLREVLLRYVKAVILQAVTACERTGAREREAPKTLKLVETRTNTPAQD